MRNRYIEARAQSLAEREVFGDLAGPAWAQPAMLLIGCVPAERLEEWTEDYHDV